MKPCHYNKHFYGLQGNIEEKTHFATFLKSLRLYQKNTRSKKLSN